MNNLDKFLEYLKTANFDALMLNSRDEFLDEFTPEHLNRLKLLTGFSGSNGIAIISNKIKAFFTDGRYLEQARNELDKKFKIYDLKKTPVNKWIIAKFPQKTKIAYDSRAFTVFEIRQAIKILQEHGIKLYRVTENPVDTVLGSTFPQVKIIEILDEKYSGMSTKDKIAANPFLAPLTGKQAFFTCDTASICWLLNIRGHDTKYTPLLHSYFIYNKKLSFLFCDINKLTDEHKQYFEELKVEIIALANIANFANICKTNKIRQVYLDPHYVGYCFYSALVKQEIDVIKITDPVIVQKSIKNNTEISGARQAHILDGIAKTKSLYWLSNHTAIEKLDEITIADKLLSFRKENPEFIHPSFQTISAFAENGSIIHYHADQNSNKKLDKNSILLIDSGGQYKCGTTDITRTVAIGEEIAVEHKRNFTLVLKGHIALATAIFPSYTTGIQLDVLARQYLWQEFKDFEHGTSHGIGSFLNVHEGPQNISKNYNGVHLKAGMILSNEPGIYINGKYGIRIENVVLVNAETDGFFSFETISLVPLDEKLIDFSLLTSKEKNWLKNYHQKIYDNLSSNLSQDIQDWLLNKIKLYQ